MGKLGRGGMKGMMRGMKGMMGGGMPFR